VLAARFAVLVSVLGERFERTRGPLRAAPR
jgi:hypothetical protein